MNKKILSKLFNCISVYVFCNNFFAKNITFIKNKRNLKLFNLNDIKKISLKFKQKNTSEDLLILHKEVQKFYEILNKNCSKDELYFFNKNIETLELFYINKTQNSFSQTIEYSALYNIFDNNIIFYSDADIITLYHELLHMASNPRIKNFNTSGFSYEIDGRVIGSALDEGYTELLAERFLNKNKSDRSHVVP